MTDVTTRLSSSECRKRWEKQSIVLAMKVLPLRYNSYYVGLLEGVHVTLNDDVVMTFDINLIEYTIKMCNVDKILKVL